VTISTRWIKAVGMTSMFNPVLAAVGT